jgi:broad specificity phosphatase PhoE
VYANKPYHSRIQTDKRYIDSPLTAKSRSGNAELKTKVKVYEPQIVLVSPQKKALQTCLDIFGDSDNVLIYVEPRLAERVSSTSAIGSDIEEIVKKFKHLPTLEQW